MISKEDIGRLLELARLDISEEEKLQLTTDVSRILEYVDKLSTIDVSNIVGNTGGSLNKNIVRNDEFMSFDFDREVLMNDIPCKQDNLVVVPKIRD
ncbi:MAG TPA: Asp-tRNA(Asn)/Glu-tRNA(Gln) amidotransferase subunit GatC [Candidatus Paceibacterota bacterium]|nr:Asp-tRNA(Asn)/Glu-tRNA(Gln) amidotransferase subunit GatC [Candidatus Paceibacterota bacterium]